MLTAVHAIHLGLSVAFLLEGSAGLVLIDAGLPGTEYLVWRHMRAWGFRKQDLHVILLTHAHIDHCGCLPTLLRESGALLAAHPLAAERLRGEPVAPAQARGFHGQATMALFQLARPWLANPRLAVDLPLEDGTGIEEWGLAASVLHTPGHTADSLTLLLEGETAFVGDLLVGRDRWAYPQPYFIEDEDALAASLIRLRQEQPRIVYAGHYPDPLIPSW